MGVMLRGNQGVMCVEIISPLWDKEGCVASHLPKPTLLFYSKKLASYLLELRRENIVQLVEKQ